MSSKPFVLLICYFAASVRSQFAKKPNFIVLLTDDQDLMLGSMRAMPKAEQHLANGGANLSNFFVNTPICCPSRGNLLSGRYSHNNKAVTRPASDKKDDLCMSMNLSRKTNPDWWAKSFVSVLKEDLGYNTGMFGKVLNNMNSYGCDEGTDTPSVDRLMVMCGISYFGAKWGDRADVHSPVKVYKDKKDSYSTSVIGNTSIQWIKSIIESGSNHKPFFAWLGPHAPHKPSDPSPWYVEHPVAELPLLKDPYWNFSGVDKHSFLAHEPPINKADEHAINKEQGQRLRSLLSVDDIVDALREYLISVDEWSNTYFIFTSDHGYNLGQFRVDSDKTQAYDHVTRVPMLVRGPNVPKRIQLDMVTSMADIAPTILELASGLSPSSSVAAAISDMDGTSFAAQLTGAMAQNSFPRDAVIVEYQSGRKKDACSKELGDNGFISENGEQCHWHDGPNNTFSVLRVINEAGNLLYSEFVDGLDPRAWHFTPKLINFRELYNLTVDPFMLVNIYDKVPASLRQHLSNRLQKAITCSGQDECGRHLSKSNDVAELIV